MGVAEPREEVHISVAADVGRVELLHARLGRKPVPPHIHDEYSISVTLRGGLAFDHRGRRHQAPSGIISCVAPGEVHNAYAAQGEDWEFINFLVPTPVVGEVMSGMECSDRLPDLPRRVLSDSALVARLVHLHRLLGAAGDILERQSALALVLDEFFRNHSTARAGRRRIEAANRAIRLACELMCGGYAQPLTLPLLATHAGLSAWHFLRVFRATVGVTPHTYLTQIRVKEARRMLSEGASAAETAAACGFCDQSHMNRQFKKVFFMTPARYRGVYDAAAAGGGKSENAVKPRKNPTGIVLNLCP